MAFRRLMMSISTNAAKLPSLNRLLHLIDSGYGDESSFKSHKILYEEDLWIMWHIMKTDSLNLCHIIMKNMMALLNPGKLCGIVGWAHKEAHAHLFYPNKSLLSNQAHERLASLEECRDLGQGFQLAERDMAIRGFESKKRGIEDRKDEGKKRGIEDRKDEGKKEALRIANGERKAAKVANKKADAFERQAAEKEFQKTMMKGTDKLEYWIG
ncbi:ATP-dependent DNA helicase [Forsythia ovata]|uniref:ATP-dependent DNA helicase n=1 Tax=Forsythia ovata TaxID=205694 RepID=A0ABD1TRP1_9LAMI